MDLNMWEQGEMNYVNTALDWHYVHIIIFGMSYLVMAGAN